MRQLEMPLRSWGGKRTARNKRKPSPGRTKSGRVVRVTRPKLDPRKPLHITMRSLPEIPNLRTMSAPITRALIAGAKCSNGFRLLHYSIQHNHFHLIVEADDARALSRGMQGLTIRIAWAVNRALTRKRGKVFSDRYYQRALRSPTETRLAIIYVLQNFKKHTIESGRSLPHRFLDHNHSSADYFHDRSRKTPLARPATWLMQGGWEEAGPIDLPTSVPRAKPRLH